MMMDLAKFRVETVAACGVEVNEVYYVPEFVSVEEETYLLRKMDESSNVKWRTLANRRLQIWGGELTPMNTLIPQPLPKFITDYPDIIQRLRRTGVFASSKHGEPNHVIVNEYLPGQGIMPHEDGLSYHPVVATLSLGSHAVFNYHRYVKDQSQDGEQDHEHDLPSYRSSRGFESSSITPLAPAGKAIDPTPIFSLLLEPRSLVITAKELYTHHLHAIEPIERDVIAAQTSGGGSCCHHTANTIERNSDGPPSAMPVKIANWQMLRGEKERLVAREGGVLERKTRISLTCRDVERVVGAKGLGKMFGKR